MPQRVRAGTTACRAPRGPGFELKPGPSALVLWCGYRTQSSVDGVLQVAPELPGCLAQPARAFLDLAFGLLCLTGELLVWIIGQRTTGVTHGAFYLLRLPGDDI